MDNIGSSIIIIDKNGNVNYANDNFKNSFEPEVSEIKQFNINSILKNGRNGEYNIKEITVNSGLDGEIQQILIIDKVQKLNNEHENEILELQSKLIKSYQELDQFVYITSHDLQEPLRMVASYVQLLQKRYNDKLSKEANEFIEFAVQGSNRMKDLLNDLLIYSRLNTKDEDVVMIDMAILFSKLLKKLEAQIIKSNTEISIDYSESVEGKYNQIFLLFENLITNGIKFNNNEKKKIIITSKLEGKSIIYSVKDNGIGISEGFFDKIFNIFQRLHSYNEYQGTGIGLALCKKIVSNHNGNIRVESIPGSGSTFFVEFKTNNE